MNAARAAALAPILVAIDGPAGSGKSSVSREVARQLGFGILDTGAVYRTLAWAAQEAGLDLDNESALTELLERWEFSISMLGEPRVAVRLPGRPTESDVTSGIRDPDITSRVSRVSRHPRVRESLNELFRSIVSTSGLPGVVIEGRDITTVVAPDAPVRVLLTAAPEVRAARRAGELTGASPEQVMEDLRLRDEKDALVVDFHTPAPGVVLIDSSNLDFRQSVQAVIDVVTAAHAVATGGASR